MKVSKEIMKKVKRLEKIESEMQRILDELLKEFSKNADGVYIDGFFIADEPMGDDQGDGEYCDQWTGYSSDSGSGVYYFPIEGSKKYIAVKYSF